MAEVNKPRKTGDIKKAPPGFTLKTTIGKTAFKMINIHDFICSNSSLFAQLKFGKNDSIFIDYLCPIQEEKARAWSHRNCLMYVMQGAKGYDALGDGHSGSLLISGKEMLLFIRKGGVILHQYFQEPYRALIFMFDDEVIQNFIAEYPSLISPAIPVEKDVVYEPSIISLNTNSFIESVFHSCLDYLDNTTPESAIALELKFKELCVNILRDKESNVFARYLSWLCNPSDSAFIKLMRENSSYNFTSKELARIAGMSLSTFKRKFDSIMGATPGKWLQQQRMIKAISFLKNSDKTISEIAFDLGYNDVAAFSKSFKSAIQINPTDYRKGRRNRRSDGG